MTIREVQNGLRDAVYSAANRIVTPRYDVRDDLGSMTDADMLRFYHATGRILVWSGGSDSTIFGDARVNWHFRAWHDFCHIKSGVCNRVHGALGCFEPVAEYAVADWQSRGLSDTLARIVQIEVSGQAKNYATTGGFLPDQIAFTLGELNR